MQKQVLLWINVLGGVATLGSYAYGLWVRREISGGLWGGVPAALRPLYTVSMLLAAAGYFAFTFFVLFRLDAARARVANRLGFGLFWVLYLAILAPSALWMPLTVAFLERPGSGLWITIRLTLAVVGLASVALVAALLALRPRDPAWAYWLAVAGSVAFTVQTAVLDALVWPAYFPAWRANPHWSSSLFGPVRV